MSKAILICLVLLCFALRLIDKIRATFVTNENKNKTWLHVIPSNSVWLVVLFAFVDTEVL